MNNCVVLPRHPIFYILPSSTIGGTIGFYFVTKKKKMETTINVLCAKIPNVLITITAFRPDILRSPTSCSVPIVEKMNKRNLCLYRGRSSRIRHPVADGRLRESTLPRYRLDYTSVKPCSQSRIPLSYVQQRWVEN